MAKYSIQAIKSNDNNVGEIVSVSDLKTYLQIEGTAYDQPLANFITSARQMIERYCNVSLHVKTYRVQIKNTTDKPFPLPFPPVTAISQVAWKKCPSTTIQLDEGTEWWEVDEDATEKQIGSTKTGIFFVTYDSGADSSPIYQQAIMAQAAYSFNNRDSDKDILMAPETRGLINATRNHSY